MDALLLELLLLLLTLLERCTLVVAQWFLLSSM
jgi:hypothetical protein